MLVPNDANLERLILASFMLGVVTGQKSAYCRIKLRTTAREDLTPVHAQSCLKYSIGL